jgi:membrane protease YdiL (CAAX protease family)
MTPVETPMDKEYPFWGYGDLALFIGAMLPSLLLATLSVLILKALSSGAASPAVSALLGQAILYLGLFAAMFVLFRIRHQKPFWKSLAWAGSRTDIARYLFLGPLVALAIMVGSTFMETPDVEMPMKDLLSSKANVVLVLIFAVTIGPLCEELVFRGFMMPVFSKSFGAAMGIVATAALFGALHLPEYGYSWRHGLLITLAGIGFGWARFKTGSTAAAVAMHATYNLTVFTAFLAQGDTFKTW